MSPSSFLFLLNHISFTPTTAKPIPLTTTTTTTAMTTAIYKNDATMTTATTTMTTTAIYKNDATSLLKSNNSASSPSLAVTIQPRRVIRCILLVV